MERKKVWLKITTSSRLKVLHCHGYNDNHLGKIMEQLWLWLEETNVECQLEMEKITDFPF